MKKIIISDYDKTLYTNDKSMLINIDMIKKFREQGNLFVIATGRSFESLKVKLTKYSIPFDYLILSNGTVILDKSREVILSYNISNNVVEHVVEKMNNFKGYIESIELFDVFSEDVKIANKFITKIRVMTKTIENAQEIALYINKNYTEVKAYAIDANRYKFAEIISINTDKGNAIEKILKIENISEENVFTIGDGSNDIEMIKKYDGYGMTDSEQCVLDVTNKLYDNVYNLIEDKIKTVY